jgi:hypothetical protein
MANLIKNAWNKLQYKAFQATYDPAANKYAAEEAQRAAESPNTRAWNEYKKMWGDRAIASGQIDPKYFGTYSRILAVPVPPDSETAYNSASDNLANMIANWYVNAKYKGDLVDLALQIQNTKPRWEGLKKDANGRPVQPKPPAKPKTTRQLFMSGFLSTFFSILTFVLIFFLCILAGSLAANDAIGRSAAIRVVYFLYAAFPIFTPFVLGYYIYRYYKGTYPLYYNMLPLTSSPGASWIIQLLKWPFYYVPDTNSEYQAEQFIRLGKALVFNGGSVINNFGSKANAANANAANNNQTAVSTPASNTNNNPTNAVPSAPLANNNPTAVSTPASNTNNNPTPVTNNNPTPPQPKPAANAQL